jgi:serine/threonine-protein kinase
VKSRDRAPKTPSAWEDWFPADQLGFDLGKLTPVSWTRTPPDAFDRVQAWEGTWPDSSEPIYVQAAAYRGRPVYFEVFVPSATAGKMRRSIVTIYGQPLRRSVTTWLHIATYIAAIFLAWRNLHTGRSDRRGALRIGVYFFVVKLAYWTLPINGVSGFSSFPMFSLAIADGAGFALKIWLFYMALEPFLRRQYPKSLISWTRLLNGRLRDPAVGRDILIGTLVGVLCVLHVCLVSYFFHGNPPGFDWNSESLVGPLPALGVAFQRHLWGISVGLMGSVLFLLLSLLFRVKVVAIVVYVLLCTIHGTNLATQCGYSEFVWPFVLANSVAGVWVLLRFGVLAYAACVAPLDLLTLPMTSDPSAFFFGSGLIVMGFVAIPAAYGCFVSSGEYRRSGKLQGSPMEAA